jgi:hypothetical protein
MLLYFIGSVFVLIVTAVAYPKIRGANRRRRWLKKERRENQRICPSCNVQFYRYENGARVFDDGWLCPRCSA